MKCLVCLLSFYVLTSLAGEPDYAGSSNCVTCHAEQHRAWTGSHHELAMQLAEESTVLGDFNDVIFRHKEETMHFFRRDKAFLVRAAGADGREREFPVEYVFGVAPLQQYLLAVGDGRYQALTVAWDSRPGSAGGQRWFHLYPDENTPPGDELHWTAPGHNWNFACAECHSTNLRKAYDFMSDSYASSWSEINVSCESCHGPASRHVELAKASAAETASYPKDHGLLQQPRGRGEWEILPGQTTASRTGGADGIAEPELCGRCHARRQQLNDDTQHGQDLGNTHRLRLLDEGLYHADGQILDEVYVYGSFVQSRMYVAGVTCSDCHEPHSLALRKTGNGVCLQCHAATAYDNQSHHFHSPGSVSAQCVNCHMEARTYMVIDPRRDHGFRIPQPALSASIGVPNACNGCHDDRSAEWAEQQLQTWYAKRRHVPYQQFGRTLHSAREGMAGAAALLNTLAVDPGAPVIARATALQALGSHLDASSLTTIQAGLASEHVLMRTAAIDALQGIELRLRWQLLSPLLDDSALSVRSAAASALADMPLTQLDPVQQGRLQRAQDEYVAGELFNADRAESWVNLAGFRVRQGDIEAAEVAFEQARQRNPSFVPIYVNHADLLRASGREAEAGEVLQAGLRVQPDAASLHHTLGLWLVRAGRMDDAIESLRRGYELAPVSSRYAYVYGVALHSTDRSSAAIKVWQNALLRHANDRDLLAVLAQTLFAREQFDAAGEYARRLVELEPDSEEPRALLEAIEQGRRR